MSTVTLPWHPRLLTLPPGRRPCRLLSTCPPRGASCTSRSASSDRKGRAGTDDHYQAAATCDRRRRSRLPGREPARLSALGIPRVATLAALSRRRTLLRGLAAFCARIRPRITAELASPVLYMGEEIDRCKRMLDAALRAVVTVPGERPDPDPATLNAAEHITALLDAADLPAGSTIQLGHWAALTVTIGSELYILTIQPGE
jgi:hypothetical protein